MMAVRNFYQEILDTLQGQTPDLSAVASERLDWAGPGALLELYRTTTGTERDALINAVGRVIEEHTASTTVLAQLIQIASALDLSQVEAKVRALQTTSMASKEPL